MDENKTKLLEQLQRMTPEERNKPIVFSMGKEHLTGEDILNQLLGGSSTNTPTQRKNALLNSVTNRLR